MLQCLARKLLEARRRKAAYDRWSRKLPHNRKGPEPPLPEAWCRQVKLPSGRMALVITDEVIETAYRQARQPRSSPDEVTPLPIRPERLRELYEKFVRE